MINVRLINIGFGNMVSAGRLIMDSGQIILSAIQPETIANRLHEFGEEWDEEKE